jgi:CRP-like cAMP-binding protein
MEPRPETFLALLDQTERDALHAIGVRRSFSRGSTLLYQDEPDDRAILLLTGRAKVTRCDEDGRELMLEIRDPGDLVGELACIDGRPRVADVTALERLEALVLPGGAFRSFLETTPQVAAKLLKIIAGRLRETTLSSERYANADTMARLASRILNLADRYGLAEGSAVTIEMPITHEELAAWTGASRAGVAKALQDIRQLGWVETERRRLVLRDLERLRARAA